MYDSYRHGDLLKEYIKENKLNRKGGINGLASELGLSRQGVYVLYKQEVIKKTYREKIIKHFNLAADFFPDPKEIEQERERKLNEYIGLVLSNQMMEDRLNVMESRIRLRWFLQNERINNRGQNIGKLHAVNGLRFEKYYYNWKDTSYIQELPIIEDDFLDCGFAFEISDNALINQGHIRGDFACSSVLIEFPETIDQKTPYIIIFCDEDENVQVLCRYLTYSTIDSTYYLNSDREEIEEIEVLKGYVSQIWLIENVIRLTPERYIELVSKK